MTTNVRDLTISEMGESLTGFEEIAISTHFHHTLSHLLDKNPTMGIRALVFTDVHRQGDTNVQASKNRAMEMPLRDVMAYFKGDEDDEDDPIDPDDEMATDAGNGDALDA